MVERSGSRRGTRRGGVLAGPVDGPARLRAIYPELPARPGLRVRHLGSGATGVLVRVERREAVVRGATGLERRFPLEPGAFAVDGEAVTLVAPARPEPAAPARTASGSRAVPRAPARVARAARIVVEGVHDAELLERVWGDDLRVEGIVVERLDGLDHLDAYLDAFRPGPTRRLGVLVDHLVPGSKEQRVVARITDPHVLVTGTPSVDVWAAIRPRLVRRDAWPDVPKGRPWKEGVCEALGVADPGAFWRELLSRVDSYADLEQPLVGAVERLIDFVAAAGDGS